ncbi:NAD(P)H-binding protein [Geodermatophilus normandii]|uniref:SDR family oxidoreductase n=1 Tax=Geodermatophilus normandii TaxID=1137989 RepID=A0A6P0GNC2_9ACTN|nr:SDR family oxidoreductase [Geodermatophilus normandii]
MTVLVAGATGTVGREVVRRLAALGADVRAGGRDPQRAAEDLPAGVPAVRLDLEDATSWPAALDGVGALFLLRPPDVARVERLQPFLDAVVAAGVRRIVLLSVQAAGRNPLLPHRALEKRVEATGLAWTHLRPANFHQNLLTVHREEIRDRSRISVPAGNGRTAHIDVRDLAEVAAAALTGSGHERCAYELTGREAPTFAEIAATLSAVLGRPVVYPRPGVVAFVREQVAAGTPPGLVLVMTLLFTTTRLGLAARTTGELERLLGREPTSLLRFVEDHADAWR